MAELIAAGTADANSADIVLTDGGSSTVFLKSGTGGVIVEGARGVIQIKSSGGHYFTVGTLDRDNPATAILGPGTFRVVRLANASAFGVDAE